MTTVEEILKKSKTKKESNFQPEKRRSWDYLNKIIDQAPAVEIEKNPPIPTEEHTFIEKKIEPEKKEIVKVSSITKIKSNVLLAKEINDTDKDSTQIKLITLSGHQKEIMQLIISHIKNRGGQLYTVDLFPNILAIKIKASLDVTRVSLKRLVEKKMLIRLEGDKGRNGCCKFKVNETIIKTCFTLFNSSPPCDINLIENSAEINL